MDYETTLAKARELYRREVPGGVFEAEDEAVRLAYMRRARDIIASQPSEEPKSH